MESSRSSLRYAGFASAFLLPVAPPPGGGAPHPALQEARLLTDADPQVASSLLRRLLFEAEADGADVQALAFLHLDAGVAALRGCDPAAAVQHAEASLGHPLLEHPARLCRLAAWVELGLPGDTADRAPGEIALLQGGPLAPEASVALVAVEALRGATGESRRAVAALDDRALPAGLRFLHLVNAGVVLLEAQDVTGALARFAAADALRRAAAATPRERAVLALNRAITVGTQALQRPDAEWAAMVADAVRLLDEAVGTLERLGTQPRLLGDCLRNRGVVRLWAGSRDRDSALLEAALRDHWVALGQYDRPPHWRRQVGDQWRNLGLYYRARRSLGDDGRAQACYDRAEAMLGTRDGRALAERDLAEAALCLDAENAMAALTLSLPAALYLDAQRFRLAGAAARSCWSDGVAEDALDDALAAAEASGRGDLASALVVWRRFGGVAQSEHEGPLPKHGPDASVLTPPPRIRGVSDSLAPYVAEAARRYGVDESELVGPVTIDLLGAPAEPAR